MAAQRAIVTGAAGGIGEAIAAALVQRGDTVLLTDIDAERLEATANDLGMPWRTCDVASAEDVAALIDAADEHWGGVDAFYANAGVFTGFGLDATINEWALSLDVNVMAHVHAARILVPRWVEDHRAGGTGGVFASTASAAGLLTQLGSPTYAVSKRAAVGFADWLAATYGDQGVRVTTLCPMGVATPMIHQTDGAGDADADLGLAAVASAGDMLDPADVAQVLLQAIDDGAIYALPHEQVGGMYGQKAADPDRWISGMQRYRATLEGQAPTSA